MPSPKSPVMVLADKLNAATPLRGFARVLAGKNQLVTGRSPPSIVLIPVSGPLKVPRNLVDSYLDVDLNIVARLWGRDLDEVWDLRARYIAALWEQAIGDPLNPSDSAAGFFFQFVDETWDVNPDSAQQGQELEVVTTIVLSASDRAVVYGRVDATSILKVPTLTVDMAPSDTSAQVDSTSGQPTVGVLHVDSEQIAYTGVTLSSFTGLIRGINGTTAAAHVTGASLSLSPT